MLCGVEDFLVNELFQLQATFDKKLWSRRFFFPFFVYVRLFSCNLCMHIELDKIEADLIGKVT